MPPLWRTMLFKDRVDVWRPARASEITGTKGAPVFTKIGSLVSCFLDRHPSVSQLELFGRVEQDDIFTLDVFWFVVDQDVREGDVVVYKTASTSPNYGKGWVLRGGPRVLEDVGIAACAHVEIVGAAIPNLPGGVS